MRPRVYVETTILSYLTALPSRDVIRTAHQQLTLDWWTRRAQFELYISEAVLAEIRKGDPAAASRRLAAAQDLTVLSATSPAEALAVSLLRVAAIPQKAELDAVHIAIAAAHGLDYLITWNCAHIANAIMRPKIEAVCREAGLVPPMICTPEELAFPEES